MIVVYHLRGINIIVTFRFHIHASLVIIFPNFSHIIQAGIFLVTVGLDLVVHDHHLPLVLAP